MAKILGLKQLNQKRHDYLENLPEYIKECFGDLVGNFIMIIWGMSGNGKSNFIMQIVKVLMMYGKVLYIGLEEGFEASMQMNVARHLNEDEHSGLIEFTDHSMTYEALITKLKRKRSPRFIVIDSLQYWNITYEMYKALKEMFPKKSFIFISHASGKLPDGKVADKIRYDAGIKVLVKDYVAHIISRYGGSKNFCIYEQEAVKRYGGVAALRRVLDRLPPEKKRVSKKVKPKKEEA